MGIVFNSSTVVWLILVLSTCTTWWLSAGSVTFTSVAAILVIAAIKIRFVFSYFMEVRHMPIAWRLAFDGWLVIVTAGLVSGIWFSA